MKIVTINTWKCDGDYPARMLALERQLAWCQPDVVALQESFCSVDGAIDTAARLGCRLGLNVRFVPARRKRREIDGRCVDSYSGLALLSRFPVNQCLEVELPSSPADGGRSAQLCEIDAGGRSVLIGNVHLSHLADGGELRRRQLERVLDHPWFAGNEDIAVVCGDFNAEPGSPELRDCLAPPWRWKAVCAGLAGKTTYRPADGTARDLDHILVGPGDADVADVRVVLDAADPLSGVLPSDHCGVAATLRWNR